LDTFGAVFTVVAFLSAVFWLTLGRAFWHGKIRQAALVLVFIGVSLGFISRAVVIPVIATSKSYRDFVMNMERRIGPETVVYLFGEFNSDPVVFYHGKVIEPLERPLAEVAAKIGVGKDYLIMPEQTWKKIEQIRPALPAPLLQSEGKGAEGDAPLVLVQINLS
jgi:hypothetical protein